MINYVHKFNEILEEIKEVNLEEVDEEIAEKFVKSLSFIFDLTKKTNPISYAVFYSMQYIFWQVVVVGGILANMKLSARLLSNSLSIFGHQPQDLVIEDDETTKLIIENERFKEKIKQLIKKYGQNREDFTVNSETPKEDILIRFNGGDLLYALHDATMLLNAKKDKDNKWKFEIEINDIYDFTDFKDLKEYADAQEKFRDIFSSTLNNLGVVSSEYGVIQTFNLKIKFETKEGEF